MTLLDRPRTADETALVRDLRELFRLAELMIEVTNRITDRPAEAVEDLFAEHENDRGGRDARDVVTAIRVACSGLCVLSSSWPFRHPRPKGW